MKNLDIAVLCITVAILSGIIGFESRPHLVPTSCPAWTDDGRPLVMGAADGSRCHYAPPPRGCENVSSEELRRMAAARDRMDPVKQRKRK